MKVSCYFCGKDNDLHAVRGNDCCVLVCRSCAVSRSLPLAVPVWSVAPEPSYPEAD